jgi:hypothetical protein
MNEALARRLAAMTGLALAAAVALWWLGSTRLAIDRGADAGRSSSDVLHVAWLVRALLVPVLGLRVGALRGGRAGAVTALAIVAPSWPVLVLAWSASTASLSQTALAEGLLLVAAIALAFVGQGLGRVLPRTDVAEPIASVVGVAFAAVVWLAHDRWLFSSGF